VIEAIELTSTRRSRGPGGPVDKVSFDVYPGQVTALLGAPGSGKSTVLRMMAELEPVDGRTLFGGRPYRALRPAVREVGLALNPDAVHPGRTVQAHLQLYSAAGGVPKARIAEVLDVAGLSTQATLRCGRLDAGQRQRLAIAAALLGDPSALILDEPHALDAHGRAWFHALIRAYAAQGRTVLVAATDPDSLAGTADHVVVLRRDEEDGVSRVIASRSAAEVFDERRATVVQVRSPQAARLAAALETEGARLSTAGPGALQVRGLDRARIGEVAHVAGICLHELSEIGHDDDVFGLRPLPDQELLPGLNQVDVGEAGPAPSWTSGVRLVARTQPVETDEAEVAVPAPETVVAAAETEPQAPVVEWRSLTGVRKQSEAQNPAQNAAQNTVAEKPPADSSGTAAEGAPSGLAAATAENQPSVDADNAQPAQAAQIDQAAEAAQAAQAAEATRAAQPPASVPSSGEAPAAEEPQGQDLPIKVIRIHEVRPEPQRPEPRQATAPPTPKRSANRAFGTFRRNRGRADAGESEIVVEATSSAAQPAVPFTVAATPAKPVEPEGMTPWRAVAARAVQPHQLHQPHQQDPVVEAASAEQEAST
jgi:ABC-type multidrug transport system ATPase subunit